MKNGNGILTAVLIALILFVGWTQYERIHCGIRVARNRIFNETRGGPAGG